MSSMESKEKEVKIKKIISLGPTYDNEAVSKIYKPYIDSALDEKIYDGSEEHKNKNIAISGNFGTGKSSIIKTYIKESKLEEKTLYVTLGSYIEKKNKDQKDNNQKEIEVSILQQIIYVVDSKDLPLSRIKRLSIKKVDDRIDNLFISILLSLLLTFSFVVIKYEGIQAIIPCHFRMSIITIFFVLTMFLILLILDYIRNNFVIKNITFGNQYIKGEAKNNNQEKMQEISLLNEHVDELIYFFSKTKYEYIVFEDIDRLDNAQVIFSKLKEINDIINIAIKDRTIRFLYAVSETIFNTEEERTKFFDVIIPVIPYISSASSKTLITRLFKEMYDPIDSKDAQIIGSYISNPRIAFDIVNEYKIFKENLQSEDIKILRELKYISAYKVLYPKRFDNFYKNIGPVSYALSMDYKCFLNEKKNKKIADLSKEITEKNNTYNSDFSSNKKLLLTGICNKIKNKNMNEISIFDNNNTKLLKLSDVIESDDKITILLNANYVLDESKNENHNIDNILETYSRKEWLNRFESLELLKNTMFELKEEKNKLQNSSYDSDEIDKVTEINNVFMKISEHSKNYSPHNAKLIEIISTLNKEDYVAHESIINYYIKIINDEKEENQINNYERRLIHEGLLNDRTKQLITIKSNSNLSDRDQTILNSISTYQILDYYTIIDEPKAVLSEIYEKEFYNDSYCLLNLFKNMDRNSKKVCYEEFYKNLTPHKIEFLIILYENGVNIINDGRINHIWDKIEEYREQLKEKTKGQMVAITITLFSKEIIKDNSYFYTYIKEDVNILSYLENNYEKVKNNIETYKLNFSENIIINKNVKNITEILIKYNLLRSTKKNIESICDIFQYKINDNKYLESILSNGNKDLENLIINDMSNTLKWIKETGIIQDDSEQFIVELIVNKNMNLSDFESLIELEKTRINNIKNLSEEEILIILKNNKLKCSLDNYAYMLDKYPNIKTEILNNIDDNGKEIENDVYDNTRHAKLVSEITFSNIVGVVNYKSAIKPFTNSGYSFHPQDMENKKLEYLIEKNKILINKQADFDYIINNKLISNTYKIIVINHNIKNCEESFFENVEKELFNEILRRDFDAKKLQLAMRYKDKLNSNTCKILINYIIDNKIIIAEKEDLEFILQKSRNQTIEIRAKIAIFNIEKIKDYSYKELIELIGKDFDRIIKSKAKNVSKKIEVKQMISYLKKILN